MRITQEADYAIRLIYLLAQEREAVQGSVQLSAKAVTPERYTLKILRKLKHQGLVESIKGVRGGYRLARDPKEISLRDIIEAIDGEIAISKCIGKESCTKMGQNKQDCCFHRIFCTLSRELAEKLSCITIADVLEQKEDICGNET